MRTLHLKIFDETYKHLNKNGCCVNLSPSTWLAKHTNNRPIAKYRKIFNGRIKDIEIIDHTIANMKKTAKRVAFLRSPEWKALRQ